MKLFSGVKIRETGFRNRSVMAPMVPNFARQDGSVTATFKDFYLARARGGVGFIVVGAAYVHQDGQGFDRQLGIYGTDLVPALSDLSTSIRRHAPVGIQLSFKSMGRLPELFQLNEIRTYRRAFARAAVCALQSGFDAVELHACHDYWLNFFLSPHFNNRSDEYGGSLKNRFRLLKETVQEVRSAIGEQLILGVRLSLDEFVPDGLSLAESLEIGNRLEETGVDYISASAGIGVSHYRISPPFEVRRGSELPLARALKESISIPVIGVGRLDRPDEFKAAVNEEHVDMVAAGRALLADPEFVAKIEQGREEEIRPCLACNFCLSCLQQGQEVRCAVNPLVGRDLAKLEPLSKPVKVLVVGGGPAGLTAAATAAKRGARVRLMEKTSSLGGALNVAKLPPFKEPVQDLIDYLVAEALRAGVDVETGKVVTGQKVEDEAPDDLILAVGGSPIVPNIPGIDSPYVLTAENLLSRDARRPEPGHYLVVGGGLVGLETACFLSEGAVEVTLVEMTRDLGRGVWPARLTLMVEGLFRAGANIITNARIVSVDARMVELELPTGIVRLGPFQAVVLAMGYRSEGRLVQGVTDKRRCKVIGDALEPRSIYEAIREGFEAALDLGE